MTENWHDLLREADFPEDGKYIAKINGWHILVCRTDDGLFAINDRCTHQAALLSPGRVRRGAIMCPLHGARFELATGRCIGGAYPGIRQFQIRVADGVIGVCVPDAGPGVDEKPVQN